MKRLAAAFLVLLAVASPAAAHKLKVFATVEGRSVHGYAFFIGGGRPEGSAWVAKNIAGQPIAEGTTDGEGRFAFALPASLATDLTITVDTHEAHIASTALAASRFTEVAPEAPASSPATATPIMPERADAPDEKQLAALVSAAVQKEVEPLLERLEMMDSRLRFTDILSGVFLIIGLVGIGLWVRGRRR